MWFHIDPSSGTPIYRQIVEQVRQAVAGGVLRSGDRLPSVRELAVDLAVNPNTIAKAYQDLKKDGVIQTLRGRGTFIAETGAVEEGPERLRRLDPVLDRLLTEAYLLGISDERLLDALRQKIALRRHKNREGSGS